MQVFLKVFFRGKINPIYPYFEGYMGGINFYKYFK